MVFSGVSLRKDLDRGPTDPSLHVGGALAPNDWGFNGHSSLSHDPLWVGQPHQFNSVMSCPTRKRSNGGVGRFFGPLVEARRALTRGYDPSDLPQGEVSHG